MKKFKCTASKRGEQKSSKRIKEQTVYESRSFTFFARNFSEALGLAEKIAKGMMVFETLKVSRA
jgi:hypothetical protein